TRYVTLSYCWGILGDNAVTTKDNLSQRLQQISNSTLPKTIQDAIRVARLLKIKYLWVDALCIIQPTPNDSGDWAHESARMGSYYRNAYCTIAAATAADCNQGPFNKRFGVEYSLEPVKVKTRPFQGGLGGPKLEPCKTVFYPMIPSRDVAIDQSPLLSRGWVLQELVLSHRALYFTKDAVFWGCRRLAATEFCPSGTPDQLRDWRTLKSGWNGESMTSRILDVQKRLSTRNSLTVRDDGDWYNLAELFSRMKLTHQTDSLAAISGLAKAWAKGQPDEYVCGIWKRSLLQGLLWRQDPENANETVRRQRTASGSSEVYIAPSWSWVS
ncbi:heterokaryon incompatibility protein-domain-containing protein, partial [Podospora australis]